MNQMTHFNVCFTKKSIIQDCIRITDTKLNDKTPTLCKKIYIWIAPDKLACSFEVLMQWSLTLLIKQKLETVFNVHCNYCYQFLGLVVESIHFMFRIM